MRDTVIVGSSEHKEIQREAVAKAISEAKQATMKSCFTVDQSMALRKAFDGIQKAVAATI